MNLSTADFTVSAERICFGLAAVKVLEKLGVAVDFPGGQTCCGQPAFNSGYRDDARRAAEQIHTYLSARQQPAAS